MSVEDNDRKNKRSCDSCKHYVGGICADKIRLHFKPTRTSMKKNTRFCGGFDRKELPSDEYHPWNDKESLYCDTEFLTELTGKTIRKGKECRG